MQKLLKKSISSLLLSKRKELKLSQEAMSEKLQISLRYYSDLERGLNIPSLHVTLNIAIVCQIDLKEFLNSLISNGYKVTSIRDNT